MAAPPLCALLFSLSPEIRADSVPTDPPCISAAVTHSCLSDGRKAMCTADGGKRASLAVYVAAEFCRMWFLTRKKKKNMPLHLIITFEIYLIKFGWKEHLIEHRLHMCRVKIIKNGRFVQFSEGQVNQLYLQHRINMTKWLAQWHSSSPKWFLAVSKHWNLITAILPEFHIISIKKCKNCSPNTFGREKLSTSWRKNDVEEDAKLDINVWKKIWLCQEVP